MRLMATYNVYNVPCLDDSSIAPYAEDNKVQYISSIVHRIRYCLRGVQDTVHAPYKWRVTHWNNNRLCEY
jgi:hypothetical protein